MPEGKLLELLAGRAGCYISSLRDASRRKSFFRMLLETGLPRYSLAEWEYTLRYLTGRDVAFGSYDEVERFLRENAG